MDILAPGGVFIVLDLYKRQGPGRLADAAALPAGIVMKIIKKRGRQSGEEKKAWKDHGKLDRYMTAGQLRDLFTGHFGRDILFRQLLFWRYLMVYRKPENMI
jgi:hypothetical protein